MNLMNLSEEDKDLLGMVHFARMKAHWGLAWAQSNAYFDGRWPQNDKEWRQTPHGASWDTNVNMAVWHLKLAKDITEGLERKKREPT